MNHKTIVYYQDEHILVTFKPDGVLSEWDEKKPSLPALLQEETGVELYPVHRLDRTTEGLIVYALTRDAASRLSEAIRRGEVEKTYLAAAEGVFREPSGELVDLLYFDRRKNKSFVVKRERRGVKTARLRYETLATSQLGDTEVSLLRILLLTGRTHQIRVQLASRQTPLIGDRRYGSRINSGQIALCAAGLRLPHPFTGEELHFSCTPENETFQIFGLVD